MDALPAVNSQASQQARQAPRRTGNRRSRGRRGTAAAPTSGARFAAWMLAIAFAGGVILLGCALPEGDADSTPPEKGAKGASNRLARETSPYLLSHAHNPVDWYPWGPEALEKARQEDKPIFLSIGYSSCHWCHVMEKKVFSDPEVARYMNEHFVNIKVDREERPDLDDIYMTAIQMYYQAIGSPQSGGWPLSIFLTPTGRPLGGGTYFPPHDEEGRTGFDTLMKRVVESWTEARPQMEKNAEILSEAVRQASRPRAALAAPELNRDRLKPVLKSLAAGFDQEYGGFGFDRRNPDRPKFPVPAKLGLLLYQAKQHDDEPSRKMLLQTLDKMAAGGIHDHVGGGFHRYSTDRFWRVPHFEKMLYDNAQLTDVYVEAFRQTGQAEYRDVAQGIIEFVFRELTDPQGAFYSALDADADGVEGLSYVWTDQQLADVLSQEELAACGLVYGTGGKANFELGHVLERVMTIDDAAKQLKTPAPKLERDLATIRQKLLAARQKRPQPARDDKILTSWNGLMIRALARAGVILERPEYTQAAAKAAQFILVEMRDDKGRLYRSYRAGQAKLNGYLDDYAFLIDGLLALRLATGDEKWGTAAQKLIDQQLQLFWDAAGKGCFFTAHHHETLLARTKNGYDSVLPSGNSVTVRNLLRLAALNQQPEYRDRARECLEVFVPLMEDAPSGLAHMALALEEYLNLADPSSSRNRPKPMRLGIAPEAAVLLAKEQASDSKAEEEIVLVQGKGERPAAGGAKPRKKPEIVTGRVFLALEELPAGGTCKVLVQLQIAEGWHLNANPSGDPEFELPTELAVSSEQGTELTKVRYPVGKKVPREEGDQPMLQYHGKVQILGLLEVPEAAARMEETLTIEVTYQACNETQCLPPKVLRLPITVPVAAKGAKIKAANEKLFSTGKK
ncbi:MAG: DUF255 domain-containing protein [Planctomycetales bacterium]